MKLTSHICKRKEKTNDKFVKRKIIENVSNLNLFELANENLLKY